MCIGGDTQGSESATMPIYFGNGCFWGRQKDFVDAETALGRAPEQVTAVVGYAGGKARGRSPPQAALVSGHISPESCSSRHL